MLDPESKRMKARRFKKFMRKTSSVKRLSGLGREVCSLPVTATKYKVSVTLSFCQGQCGIIHKDRDWGSR